jgi:signal transduction histidine kinase
MYGAVPPAGAPSRARKMQPFVYIESMAVAALSVKPRGIAVLLHWRRVLFVLGVAMCFGLPNSLVPDAPPAHVTTGYASVYAFVGLLMFGLFEQRPSRLPPWLPRWSLQLVGVVLAMPLAFMVVHGPWMAIDYHGSHELNVMVHLGIPLAEGLLFGPWIALGAMVRQRDVFVRDQALAFELERSRLERSALDTRLRLLQAQVEPHFLFNTLANVQALVEAGSPQASGVLTSLIAYLRAAVPRMHEPATTLGRELELVRAYLELMRMRMPDRLEFALNVDPRANTLRCPPVTLLTLVENAVRHGIDPSEEGGRIDVDVRVQDGRCLIRVTDTGIGLAASGSGLGTGLSTLRERLQLAFGGDAQLRLTELVPHGVSAELDLPAREDSR